MAERRPPARRPSSSSRTGRAASPSETATEGRPASEPAAETHAESPGVDTSGPHTDPPAPAGDATTSTETEPAGPLSSPPRVGGRGKKERPERHGLLGFLRELPGLILIAFVLALVIKTFVIQAFFIPSKSMEPTFLVGDRVIVNKFIYDFREPRHGEVVVFENPNLQQPDRSPPAAFWHWLTEGLGFSADPNKDFIKRVIAAPGDTVEVRRGVVFVNGEELEEPYARQRGDRSDFGPKHVPEDSVFVMGDNRANSQDSRVIGFIPLDNIVGKAFLIIWEPSRIRWLSGA
ncbi:MAG: signal peptidase I [Actinomycetota bacterium]